jgi:hypothetical protein
MVSNGIASQKIKITMNLPASIAEWIAFRLVDFPSLTGVQILVDGETETAAPPMIVINETGSARTEQDGVPIRGVSTVSLTVELHTIPADDGTSADDARTMARELYDIIGDIDGMKQFCDGLNLTAVLDIFADSPIVSADAGRRVATVNLEILASPAISNPL